MRSESETGRTTEVMAAGTLALEALHAENRAAAARLRACYELHALCEELQTIRDIEAGWGPEFDQCPSHAVVDPFDIACAELVAVYGVHHHRASAMLKLAISLVTEFPAIVEAMESGRLDEHTANMLARHMRTVDLPYRGDVHRAVINWLMGAIDSGKRPGRRAILDETDRIISAHDPEGVLLRRSQAVRERNVRISRDVDGMSTLRAYITTAEARAIEMLVQKAAAAQKEREKEERLAAARDPDAPTLDATAIRGNDELRADALVDLLLGPLNSASTTPGTAAAGVAGVGGGTAEGQAGVQIRPNITVLAPLSPAGEPEIYLPRGGPEAIDALIALLARSVGATIQVPETEPGTADSPSGSRRYRLNTELIRRVRLRDGTCRHPGCSVPADNCDVDHARPFDHSDPESGGLSVESNLMCLCRRHHRFKTFHGWRYQLEHDGKLTVRTDTGHTVTTDPAGPLARWRQQRATSAAAATSSDPAANGLYVPIDRPWLSPRPRSTAWFRRAHRLAAERLANSAPPPPPRGEDPDADPPPF
ncbi:HNH endonuclease signature motif containing protein [Dietzia alimentaria]|uniref:HNH endonuclease signature motif containing protein n=1 Tax=Dietzia alimentaria TaxID=665550 RepID=UPI00029AE4F3|nr:HNH endonuclease signature motif containing protein [Dietzia alimentaria]